MSTNDWIGFLWVALGAPFFYGMFRASGSLKDSPRWELALSTLVCGIGALMHVFDLDRADADGSLGVTVGMLALMVVSTVLVRHEGRRLRTDAAFWLSGYTALVCGLTLL